MRQAAALTMERIETARMLSEENQLPRSNYSGRRLAAPPLFIEAPSGNIMQSCLYASHAENDFLPPASLPVFTADVNGYAVPVQFNVDKHRWQTIRTGQKIPTDHSATVMLELPPLPELPRQVTPIPKILHSIWVGGRIPDHLLNNLVANRQKLPQDYKVVLHLDVAPDYFARLVPVLAQKKIHAVDIRKEPLFDQSDITDFNTHYEKLKDIGIWAANSDLVRFPILTAYGGIYMDLDDKISVPCDRLDLAATDAILLGLSTAEMHGEKTNGMLNNTPIAATKNSRICKAISTEIAARLSADIALLAEECPEEERRRRLFQLTGPFAMDTVIREWMPEVRQFATYQHENEHSAMIKNMFSPDYHTCLEQRFNFFFPFNKGVEPGSEGSWRAPRTRT